MKNYLARFGIIMAVGLSIALVGSNPASSALASLLSVVTGVVDATSTTTTETTSATVATTTETTGGNVATSTATENATTSLPLVSSAVIEKPRIVGIQNGDVVTGIRNVAVGVFGNPMAVRAEVHNPAGVIQPIYPECPEIIPSMLSGTMPIKHCYFTVNAALLTDGEGYKVRGLAKYLDGSLLTTDIVVFSIKNPPALGEFLFAHPVQYATVSGISIIQGTVEGATGVTYKIFKSGNASAPVMSAIAENVAGAWEFQWNTRSVTNGNYIIEAQITDHNNAVTTSKTMLGVTVSNETPIVTTPTTVAPTQPVNTQPVVAEPTVEPVSTRVMEPVMMVEQEKAPEQQAVTSEPAKESEGGFFQNVRNLIRSAVTPKEDVPAMPEAPKPVVVVSATVQRLEQVSNDLQAAAQKSGVIPQSALNTIAKDSDGDGIPDYQEVEALRTNPLKRDTDGDGIDDGTEVRQGSNPLNADRSIKIAYENAKLLGETVKPELLKIETVALATTTELVEVEVATTTASGDQKTVIEKKPVIKEKVRFTGKTLPYALVTIYVYSDIPTIVTVKADKNGSWSYALDKTLDDGNHQAYVTINDSTGKIVAKSQALGFVKTAQAITVANIEGLAEAAEGEPGTPVETSKRNFGIVVALVIGLGLLIGIFLVVRSFRNQGRDIV